MLNSLGSGGHNLTNIGFQESDGGPQPKCPKFKEAYFIRDLQDPFATWLAVTLASPPLRVGMLHKSHCSQRYGSIALMELRHAGGLGSEVCYHDSIAAGATTGS